MNNNYYRENKKGNSNSNTKTMNEFEEINMEYSFLDER